jgi:hypothetical protein
MKIKETILPKGGKIINIVLTPAEVSQLTMEMIGGTPVQKYWFDTIVNDSEYNISIEIDRSVSDNAAIPNY